MAETAFWFSTRLSARFKPCSFAAPAFEFSAEALDALPSNPDFGTVAFESVEALPFAFESADTCFPPALASVEFKRPRDPEADLSPLLLLAFASDELSVELETEVDCSRLVVLSFAPSALPLTRVAAPFVVSTLVSAVFFTLRFAFFAVLPTRS